MEKNNKQTAVEFAVEKLEKFIPEGNQIAIYAILKTAKEIEKQQIIDSYNEGQCKWDSDFEAKQYYNETFK